MYIIQMNLPVLKLTPHTSFLLLQPSSQSISPGSSAVGPEQYCMLQFWRSFLCESPHTTWIPCWIESKNIKFSTSISYMWSIFIFIFSSPIKLGLVVISNHIKSNQINFFLEHDDNCYIVKKINNKNNFTNGFWKWLYRPIGE